MTESEFSVLKQEVMVAADTKDVSCGRLGKPRINIIEGLNIFTLETAKVAAVNQNIAIGDAYFPMLSMRISDDAEGCHLIWVIHGKCGTTLTCNYAVACAEGRNTGQTATRSHFVNSLVFKRRSLHFLWEKDPAFPIS